MVNTLGLRTRAIAEQMGQKLVEALLVEHVVEAQPFKDKYLFFRFSSLLDAHSCSHSERIATLSSIHDLTGYPSSSPSPPQPSPLSEGTKRRSLSLTPHNYLEDVSGSDSKLGTRAGRFSADSAGPFLSGQQQANEFIKEIADLPFCTPMSSYEVMVRSFPALQQRLISRIGEPTTFDLTATKKAHYRRSKSPSKMSRRGTAVSLESKRTRSRSMNSSRSKKVVLASDVPQQGRSRTPSSFRRTESSSFDDSIPHHHGVLRSDSDYPEMPEIPSFSSDDSSQGMSTMSAPRDLYSDSEPSMDSSEALRDLGGGSQSEDTSSKEERTPRSQQLGRRSTKNPRGPRVKKLLRKKKGAPSTERSKSSRSEKHREKAMNTDPTELWPRNQSRFVSTDETAGAPSLPLPPKRSVSSEAVLSPRSHPPVKKSRRSGSASSLPSEEEALPLCDDDLALITAIDMLCPAFEQREADEAALAATKYAPSFPLTLLLSDRVRFA